jgi:hypothetical protein
MHHINSCILVEQYDWTRMIRQDGLYLSESLTSKMDGRVLEMLLLFFVDDHMYFECIPSADIDLKQALLFHYAKLKSRISSDVDLPLDLRENFVRYHIIETGIIMAEGIKPGFRFRMRLEVIGHDTFSLTYDVADNSRMDGHYVAMVEARPVRFHGFTDSLDDDSSVTH